MSGNGAEENCKSGLTVVSQKLYLLAKKWQVPCRPWHSRNGAALKSSRQLPGDMRACPPPWSPAPVCYPDNRRELGLRHAQTNPDPISDTPRSGPDFTFFLKIIPRRRDYDLLRKGGSVVKNLPAMPGDTGSIPGLRRSPGGGNGNPLQYSCLENSMDKRSLTGYILWGLKESDTTESMHIHTHTHHSPRHSSSPSRSLSLRRGKKWVPRNSPIRCALRGKKSPPNNFRKHGCIPVFRIVV